VILLDEPTTGVDPLTRQDFWQLIIQLVTNEGVAMLISTPYMDEASRCARVGFQHHGRLLVEGSPSELRARLAGRIVEMAGQPQIALRHLAEADAAVEDVRMFGDRLHLRVQDGTAEAVIARLSKQVPATTTLTRMRVIPPQLEDVFIVLSESGA